MITPRDARGEGPRDTRHHVLPPQESSLDTRHRGRDAWPHTLRRAATRERLAPAVVACMAIAWTAVFGWLALQRHLAGGSHAEDLGFTEQVLWNFLPPRAQWFRMSIYVGAAAWNTELDVSRVLRPDSLLAFHFEPLLLLLVPFYALGGMPLLLVLQSAALAAGAGPAFRLARHLGASAVVGVAVAAAYLLAPFGQWAALADVHTVAFAAPLLLLAVERWYVARAPKQALLAAVLAAAAREDAGCVVATLGAAEVVRRARWRGGVAFIAAGLGFSAAGALVIRAYSGGGLPFDVRYTPALSPGGLASQLTRPDVREYLLTVLASGGWVGLLAPLAVLPGLPSLALNVLSASTWMAAGKAHYSALVLPFVAIGAAAGLGTLRMAKPSLIPMATAALLALSTLAYVYAGAGPLGANFSPAVVTDHARRAAALAANLPPDAAVAASTALVPRLSQRARVYVFPAVLDADYVFLDLRSTPAPTSAGDVFLRVQRLLAEGDWQVDAAEDGLLLLERRAEPEPIDARVLARVLDGANAAPASNPGAGVTSLADGLPVLLHAELMPSPDGAVDIDGPHWILRTVWRTPAPQPRGMQLRFLVHLRDGQTRTVWDVADLWWHPPERWTPGEPVVVDVPDIAKRNFLSFEPVFALRSVP